MNSDDEDILGHKRFLQVNLPSDYDPDKSITNGEEFLQWVIYEARTTPSVVKAELDISKFSKNQTLGLITDDNDKFKIPTEDLPTFEWQTKKLADFKEFRKYVHAQLPDESSCLGSPTTSSNMDKVYPYLSRLGGLSPMQQLKVLASIVKMLTQIENGAMFNDFLGSWILMSLTLIDDPILCDIAFTLRELCKECMRLRYHLYINNGQKFIGAEALPLNMFICIITKFFLQKDLCEA